MTAVPITASANAHPTDGPTTMPSDTEGWWESERAEFIRSRIAGLVGPGSRLADVGGGRGAMLADDRLSGSHRVCVDSHIWAEWDASSGLDFVCASAQALPFRPGTFDLVGSFDVIEHIADDRSALVEQRRATTPDGYVIGAVPAGPSLWSAHDDEVGHQRRYTADSVAAALESAGLAPSFLSHSFSFLWLPARLLRSSPTRRSEPANSNGVAARVVRSVIGALSAAERRVINRRTIPFGTSIYFESRFIPTDSAALARSTPAPTTNERDL